VDASNFQRGERTVIGATLFRRTGDF